MNSLVTVFTAALGLVAAAYAHAWIPRHTSGTAKIALARSVLIVTGAVVGAIFARYAGSDHQALLAFLIGFGGVHVPAAIILFLKGAARMGKS